MQLDSIPLRQSMRVAAVNWAAISEHEGHRLRSLGLDVGADIEALHRGILFWRDPIAVRVGRMTIALRLNIARQIACSGGPG